MVAHRLSWELHFGPIPSGLKVLHRCDNPPCVRPDHLFIGTQSDNLRDAAIKGRITGEKSYNCKVSDANVRDLRARHARGESGKSLAARFGINRGTVYEIASGRKRAYVAQEDDHG